MSLSRELPSRNLNILSSPPDTATTASPIARTSSNSSRNDLFTTSWQPEIPPPRPLAHDNPSTATTGREEEPTADPLRSPAKISSNGVHANTMPSPMKRRDFFCYDANPTTHHSNASSPAESGRNSPMLVDEFGVPKRGHVPSSVTVPAQHHNHPYSQTTNPNARQGSPRTSSFFDVVLSTDLPAPPPAPPRATPTLHSMHASNGNSSPINLSRSTSLRRAPPPPLLPLTRTGSNSYNMNGGGSDRQRSWDSYTSSIPSSPSISASYATAEEDPLSPLHQSPQLPPSRAGQADWIPPLPPAADDIELRLLPSSTYLLGEGRYAKVYLAAYKRKRKLKIKGREELLGRIPPLGHSSFASVPVRGEDKVGAEEKKEVNEDGDGLVGGDWKLCAVKRLAPDRESQTMGLREAFFLNRLMVTSPLSEDGRSAKFSKSGRERAVSPLRDSTSQTPRQTPKHTPRANQSRNGSVYITKLIAVKEDVEGSSHSAHARSTSDAIKSQKTMTSNGTLTRQRSSTMLPPHSPTTSPVDRVAAKVSVGCSKPDITNISSFPSFPSLAQAIRQEYAAPSLSRLVLVLEHAPLGTLDRLLRTSPQLVGKKLWGRWAREGVEALEWVHGKGVVHADIKPGNLLVRGR